MFNIRNESQRNKLENIIRDYFIHHQETENTFLNGFNQLNQLRLQTQAQNWSNFLIKLNQIQLEQQPLPLNNSKKNNFYNPLFKISNNNNTTSITIQPQQQQTGTSQQHTSTANNENMNNSQNTNNNNNKSRDEYKCGINECSKVYTTKGNLNRHLKDFHSLNSDFTPLENGKHKKAKSIDKSNDLFDCDECSQCFSDAPLLKQHKYKSHSMKKGSVPPPKPPKPPCFSPTNTNYTINAFDNHKHTSLPTQVALNNHNNNINGLVPSFPALMHLKNGCNNTPNKVALNLPFFNLNPKSNAHDKYDGLDILLQAADALDKESSNARKRKYENEFEGGGRGEKGRSNKAKRRKVNGNDVRNGSDARIAADVESGICSLCKRTQKQKNTSNYNWINHLQSDHRYKCNVSKCKCSFTQKQYLNDHMDRVHDESDSC